MLDAHRNHMTDGDYVFISLAIRPHHPVITAAALLL